MRTLSRIPFTQSGFEALVEELKRLKEERKDAVLRLKAARDLGDLSENGLYKGARANLTRIDSRLRQLDSLIKLADIQKGSTDIVSLDRKITVTDGKTERMFHMVGSYESNPAENKISPSSPIGSALMGKKIGDRISVSTTSGLKNYTIVKIK